MMNNYNSLSYRKLSKLSSQGPDVVGNAPNSSGTMRTSWLMSLSFLFLFLIGNISSAQCIIGTGTLTTDGSTADPLERYYNYEHFQMIYTAAELTAGGMYPGSSINAIGFSVSESASSLANFTISMGHTTQTSAATYVTSLTVVKPAFTYAPVVQTAGNFDMITLTTPFIWDGTSNIVVNTCTGSNPFTSPYGGLRYSTAQTGAVGYTRTDTTSNCGNTTNANTATTRPNIRFNFTGGTPPACSAPTLLTTSAVTATTATISWTAPTAAPSSGYNYEIRTSGAAGSGATGLVLSGSTSAGVVTQALTGLTANTSYSAYVQSNCGTSTSTWTAATAFTTPCAAVGLPWSEGFEGLATVGSNLYPSCWNYTNITSTNSSYSGTGHAGTKYIGGSWSFDVWYFTPPVNLTSGTSYTYSYWMREADAVNGYTVTSTVGSAASVAGQTTVLNTNVVTSSATWVQKSFTYTPSTSGVYYFGIHNSCPTSAPNGIYFDDFSVTVTPTCLEPTLLTSSSVTNNAATIGWTASSTPPANGYDYYVSTTNTAPIATTTPTGNVPTATLSAALSGLTSNTTYYFWVRSNCSVSDQSAWTASASFATLCDPIITFPWTETFETTSTTLSCFRVINGNADANTWSISTLAPFTGTRGAAMYTDASTTNNDYLITPQLTLGSQAKRVTFWVRAYSAAEPDEISVRVSTTGTALANFSNVAMASIPVGSITYTKIIVDLSAYANQSVYLALVRDAAPANGWYLLVDDITVENIPTCFEPASLTASAITAGGVTLTWPTPSAGTPVNYEYEIRTAGAAGSGSTGLAATGSVAAPTLTAVITGLTASTNYSAYVRSSCGGSDFSAWTPATTFKTLCLPATAPTLAEGFATYVPDCWYLATGALTTSSTLTNTTNGWFSEAGFGNTGTDKAVRINLYGTKNDWLISNQIDLGSGGYRIKYKMGVTNYLGTTAVTDLASHKVDIVVSTDGGTTWSNANVVKTYTGTGSYSATGQTEYINIGSYTGTVRIAFVATTTSTSPDIDFHVDNFQVEVIPTTVSSFSPTTVCSEGASTVTISGYSFTGATSVTFGSTPATSFTVVNDNTITAVAPLGVSTDYITVVGPLGTSTSPTQLSVTPNPTVAAISGGGVSTCYPDTVQLNDTTPSGTWSSSDNDIATVDGSGLVTPVGEGTVTISYTVPNGVCLTTVDTPITVNMPVAISASTTSQTVVTGNNAVFSVTASGTGLTYQWQVSTDDGASFNPLTESTPYSGTNSASLTITSTPDTYNGYQYMCTVSGTSPCAALDSTPAILNVGNTGITTDPSPVALCDSGAGTAVFSVVATGTVDSYAWEENQGLGWNPLSNTTVGGVTYSGTDTDTLSLSGLTLTNNAWSYRAVVTGPANTAISNGALLSVNQGVVFTGNPSNQTVCYTGGVSTFTAAASGTFSAYQWQYSANGSSWAPVANGTPVGATYSGAATGTLTVTTTAATPAAGTYYYKAVALAAAPCTNVDSATAQLLINNPTITTGPSATTVVAGNTATFSVAASAASPTYQWQRATALAGPYTNVVDLTPATVTYTGATTATLSVVTTSGTAASTANFYRCIVTSGGTCSATSTGAQLTISTYCQPATTTGGTTDSVTNVVITNVTTATNITQASGAASPWYTFYNNTPLNVTQGQSMSVAMTFGTDGTQYSAVWVDYNRDGVFSATENVALATAAAAGGATVTYNFTVPFTATPGVTRIRLRGASDSAYTAAGDCTSSSYGETEDYLLNVIVAPACSGAPVAGTAVSSVANVCYTGTANLSVSGYSTGVTGISLQWYNSAGAISGAINPTFTTPILSAPETYFCRVTCANGGAYTDTNILSIGVDAPSVTGTTPNTRCGTGSVALAATGSAGTTLGWYAAATGGAPLGTGATFNTPSIAATTTYYVQANVGGGTESGGKPSTTGASGSYVGTDTGIVFNATSQFNLNSAVVYPTGTGTMTVALYNSSGTELASTSAIPVTGTGLATPVTLPLNFTVPVGTGYRLLLKAYTGITGLLRDSSGNTYPYNSTNSSVTSGYISGTSTSYYFFYNLGISTGCSSARTAVTATVTAPPALSISSATSTICNGLSTTIPVTVTSTLGDYDTYTWSPSTGVSGSAASGYTFNPTATTTYTLTATNASGCANTATHTVTVNALPSVFAVTPATSSVCSVDAPVLLAVAPSNPTPSPSACTESATNGQWPSSAYTATTCDGAFVNSIATNCYAGEYSLVNTSANTVYTFSSSGAGDYVTITNATGSVVYAYGLSPLTWYNDVAATQVRFHTELSTCLPDSVSRTRSFTCKPVDSVVFTPSTGLFTDAAGTVAYTGTAVVGVYAKPASTTTYTATATNANGCIRTAMATINVTPATTWYTDADGDGYGSPTAATTLACSQPVGFVSNSTDCNDAVATTHPGAVDVCYDGIDNDCNGNIDNVGLPGGCTPINTVVQGTQCGTTLATIDQYVYANLVANAQGYRFKVTDLTTSQVQTIDKALRVFQLTQLGTYAFNRTYQVEVSVRINNVWQPYYGSPCTVTTPATTTSLQSAQCGSTLTAMGDVIYANNVPFAAGYRFRVVNLLTSQVQTIDRPIRDFRMTLLATAPEFNSTYTVEVAVKNTDGTYLPYGSSCNITTPSFPTTQIQTAQCDYTAVSASETFYADSNASATMYRFKFENTGLGYVYTIDRPTRSFVLSTVPGLLPATPYSVSVSIQIGGVFGPYGKICTLTTPGAARPVTVEATPERVITEFKATAYPNPFAENFKLDVNTSSEEVMQVRVYDMLGKLVEERQVKTTDLETLTVGDRYSSGVYNVIVTQGENTQTVRVIKR